MMVNEILEFNKRLLTEYPDFKAIFFVDFKIIVNSDNEFLLPVFDTTKAIGAVIKEAHLCDTILFLHCQFSSSLEDTPFVMKEIRSFLVDASQANQILAIKAYHWLNWSKQSQFCGFCGQILQTKLTMVEKYCVRCAHSIFPRFSPAVMVLIQRDKEILLARSKHFKPGVYSAIAGFVELGETAEMAVHREVMEETGLKIAELAYFSTQTWPFPDSFMIAFTANYVSGELKIDFKELEDARWFSKHDLPQLPHTASIARSLIDHVVKKIA